MLVASQDANIAGWVCAALSLITLITRVIASRIKHGSFDASGIICFVAIVVVTARTVVNAFVLKLGTSNDFYEAGDFSAGDLRRVKTGSILALIARLLVTTIYCEYPMGLMSKNFAFPYICLRRNKHIIHRWRNWNNDANITSCLHIGLQTCILLLFYSRIFEVRARWTTFLIRMCWGAIPLSYVAVVLTTFLECHPFKLYWQVEPPSGNCIRAYIQLLTQGISNIILDLILLAISCPLIAVRHRTIPETLRVGMLFCLGFFCMIVTAVRIRYIYADKSYQPVRSFCKFWFRFRRILCLAIRVLDSDGLQGPQSRCWCRASLQTHQPYMAA